MLEVNLKGNILGSQASSASMSPSTFGTSLTLFLRQPAEAIPTETVSMRRQMGRPGGFTQGLREEARRLVFA